MNGAILGQQYANQTLSNLSNTQTALANLGAGVRPRRGINMDFTVNQRGQSSYTASGKTYTVDGWYLSSTGMTCAVGDGQVTITPNGNKYNAFVQILEQNYADGAFTFSVLASGASGQTVGVAVLDNSVLTLYAREGFVLQDGLNLLTVTAQIPESSPGQSVILYPDMVNGTAPATFYSAKPEEGESQTLAYKDSTGAWKLLPQPDMDYATQLAKCLRYLVVIESGKGGAYFPVGYGMAIFETLAKIQLSTPVPIRNIAPTVSFSGSFQLVSSGTTFSVTNITLDTLNSPNVVSLGVQASGLTPGSMCRLSAKNDATAKIVISAEL